MPKRSSRDRRDRPAGAAEDLYGQAKDAAANFTDIVQRTVEQRFRGSASQRREHCFQRLRRETMRTSLWLAAALVFSTPPGGALKADETTVIHRDSDSEGSSTTVIEKHESDDHAVIIEKEHEE